MKVDELLLYKEERPLLQRFCACFDKAVEEFSDNDRREFFDSISELVNFGAKHGFYGNLWHCYITYVMVYNENPYSIDCEMHGNVGGTFDSIAKHDFTILKELFDYDLSSFDSIIDMSDIKNFSDGNNKDKVFNKRIRDCICDLSISLENAKEVNEFQSLVVDFYKHFGVGEIGLHKAFRLDENGDIVPITKIAHVTLDDLVGYDIQKEKLLYNTKAFLAKKSANNCLLYGDAGTGKSTSIKAISNQFYEDGLRIIEVYKHQFKDLNKVISLIKNRNYRFIIYMDDLSFEEFEIEYKYLKAVIEGGLEKKPENVLIYATSNRRHLVREKIGDNKEYDDMHKNDTKQEKLSLSNRFGVTIYYGAPTPKDFKAIVLALRDRYEIDMDDEAILLEANKWELSHGGLSGRTAQQFIDHLRGQE